DRYRVAFGFFAFFLVRGDARDFDRLVAWLGDFGFHRFRGAFEAVFAVAALAELGGAPGPHGAVVAQRHPVGVRDRDVLDAGELARFGHHFFGTVAVSAFGRPVAERDAALPPPHHPAVFADPEELFEP